MDEAGSCTWITRLEGKGYQALLLAGSQSRIFNGSLHLMKEAAALWILELGHEQ
jgi:hypothetical protein